MITKELLLKVWDKIIYDKLQIKECSIDYISSDNPRLFIRRVFSYPGSSEKHCLVEYGDFSFTISDSEHSEYFTKINALYTQQQKEKSEILSKELEAFLAEDGPPREFEF